MSEAPAQHELSDELLEKIQILRFSTTRPAIVDELVAVVRHAESRRWDLEDAMVRSCTTIVRQNNTIKDFEETTARLSLRCDSLATELTILRSKSIFRLIWERIRG